MGLVDNARHVIDTHLNCRSLRYRHACSNDAAGIIHRTLLAGEWYRFPSSFHLPHPAYRLRFIKSDFDGALPVGRCRLTPYWLQVDPRLTPDCLLVDPIFDPQLIALGLSAWS
jgi:hypothetical protein